MSAYCTAAVLAAVLAGGCARDAPGGSSLSDFPQTVIVAGDVPERLTTLPPHAGVAFVAATVRIDGGEVAVAPRRHVLEVPRDTALLAVTRFAATPRAFVDGEDALDRVASAIAATAAQPRVRGVQIDFDATIAQRAFYRDLIRRVRAAVPLSIGLSMTASMAWCMGDDWMSDLPVDEVVPLAFPLGSADRAALLDAAASGWRLSPLCRGSLGVSTGEPIRRSMSRRGRRLYVFHPGPWTPDALERAATGVTPWW